MPIDLNKLSPPTLEAVRQNLGVDAQSTAVDERIKAMRPIDIVKCYSSWHFGSNSWGVTFYNVVREADRAASSAEQA